ncbi:TetR/AcrR family transcriptional regulator [Rhizobium sp. KVB221]|uniref:TetR/AcrR family transcriptional regulator n=1 Tax=Rhizobium setariae TaxID=2801340 RepID=A0A936YLY7_9HYPH|nr:TetR/AcrR family transcriptional regulator [Rhizobium setariae]MBL0370601.1 TetR/AcrR family transcriptional regulator [Rhizobium setariae]
MSQDNSKPPVGKPGRPRSEAARRAILQTAHEILVADGLGRLTIEAVAERARVGKPTIYRYWRNAQELAMAALMADTPLEPAAEGHGSARMRLQAHVEHLLETFTTVRGRQIAQAMAAADQESELAKAFRSRVILQYREKARSILTDAQANGEIALKTDIEVILDMLHAPVFYRLLVGHQPLSQSFGLNIIDTMWAALAPTNGRGATLPKS